MSQLAPPLFANQLAGALVVFAAWATDAGKKQPPHSLLTAGHGEVLDPLHQADPGLWGETFF